MKLTNEPPKGIKANVSKTYGNYSEDLLNDMSEKDEKRNTWKKILFSLSVFHAVV